MYKVLPVEGGWLVFFAEEGKLPRPVDGRTKPYKHATHAHRRRRQLEQAAAELDKMVKRDGAIII